MAIDLAKLVVRLEAQSAQLLTELEKANRKIDRFASATSKTLSRWAGGLLAAFSAKAIAGFVLDVIKAQDQLGDMAVRAGETVETISRLGYAAEQSGTDVETLNTGLKSFNKIAADAAKGGKDSAAAFKAIGVEVENADGSLKSQHELLLDIADQFSRYEDGIQKSAIAQKFFGKSGEELIPFLNKGRAGIAALEEKADRLGITLSSKGAAAADEFGDRMNTLGRITRGIVAKALEEVLPIVNRLTEGLEGGAEGSERWDKAARVLAAGMKILITTGIVVGEIFDRVGDAIGAAAVALTKVAKGNFREAYDVIIAANEETAANVRETVDEIAKVWSDGADAIGDDLDEVSVKVRKVFDGIDPEAADKLREKLEAAGKAMTESVATPYERLQATIKKADELLAAHVITLETWKRAVGAAADEVDPFLGAIVRMGDAVRDLGDGLREEMMRADAGLEDEIQKAADKVEDRFDKELKEKQKAHDAFIDEARRNTQDILADGLEEALHGGIEKGAAGALDAFGKMLERMALQAIAAKLADKIFGSGTSGGATPNASGGDWLDSIISWGAKLFGASAGPKDSGGSVRKGVPYMIGRGAQPEMFVPDSDGKMYPSRMWGGAGGGVTQNIYTSSPITQRSARQIELEAARNQRIATARMG